MGCGMHTDGTKKETKINMAPIELIRTATKINTNGILLLCASMFICFSYIFVQVYCKI